MNRQGIFVFFTAGFLMSGFSRKPVYTNDEILSFALVAFIILGIMAVLFFLKEKQNREAWQAAGALAGMQEVEDLGNDWAGMFGTHDVDKLTIFCGSNCCCANCASWFSSWRGSATSTQFRAISCC